MQDIILLCAIAFLAGFIDAIAGGGGLIQLPAMLIFLPHYSIATVIGTNKFAGFMGTSMSTFQYARQVDIDKPVVIRAVIGALSTAFLGAYLLTIIHPTFMKPGLLVILIVVAIYTFMNKSFGMHYDLKRTLKQRYMIAWITGISIGLYDGMIGPGAGSFLMVVFISMLGYDFLHASAMSKFVNLAANISALFYFAATDNILYQYALPMGAFNIAGAYTGSKLAILRGSKFVRIFFMIVIALTILRFGYDVFFKKT